MSILLMPLVSIIIIYTMATDALLEYQYRQTSQSLENTAASISIKMEELNNIHTYIAGSPMVNSIINHGKQGVPRDISRIYDMLSNIPSYSLTNQLIQRVVIVIPEAQYVAVPPSGFALNEETYSANLHFAGISYEDLLAWCEEKHMGTLVPTLCPGGESNGMLMLRNIQGSRTLIVIQLSTPAIRQLLADNDIGTGGGTYLLDRAGRQVSSTGAVGLTADELRPMATQQAGQSREVDHEGKIYLSCVLYRGGLSYISLVEKEYLLAQVAPIKYIMIALGSVSLAASLLMCLVLWRRRRRNAKQVELAARKAGILAEAPRSEEHLYKTTFTNMTNTLDTLRKALDRQQDALRDTVLRNALLGAFGEEADLQTDMQSAGLHFEAEYYYVVNVLLLRPSELGADTSPTLAYRLFLKQLLADAFLDSPIRALPCDIGSNSFALLLLCKEQTPEQLIKTFVEITRQIEGKDWIPPTFAISGGCRELAGISKLYEQTDEIAEYLICLDMYGVFHHSALPQSGDPPYLSVDDELHFMQLLNAGSAAGLEEFWHNFLGQNITKRSLSVDMLVNLRERLRQCLLRVLAKHPSSEELDALMQIVKKAKPLEGIYQCAVQVQSALALADTQNTAGSKTQTKAVMQAAIEENYADSMFSLYMLAQMVGMQENVLYRVFKNFFGASFSSYLEQYRINRAFELLRGQMPIKEVAARVGYTSDHSFRRAFKRIMKIPPSQFGSAEE